MLLINLHLKNKFKGVFPGFREITRPLPLNVYPGE